MFVAVGISLEAELARYAAVIHLRTPHPRDYTRGNPLRIETATEAAAIDDAIALAWRDHPRRFVIDSRESFLHKAEDALTLLRSLLPPCCA
jgi:hypothetical protein